MNVTCPECTTTYRVDPAKVPSGGVTARCARCPATFRVADAPASENYQPSPELPTLVGAGGDGIDSSRDVAAAGADVEAVGTGSQVLATGSRFEISLMGEADRLESSPGPRGDDSRDADEDAPVPDASSTYAGAADVAFHTDEAPDDLPYLEGSVVPVGGASDDDTPGEEMSTVSAPEPVAEVPPVEADPEEQPVPDSVSAAGEAPLPPAPFGARSDPHRRAARLARALVSDIVVYYPERRTRSLRQGTLRQEFREEIRKSWEEYANQVGGDFARQTTYFRDALNQILADGVSVF